MRFNFYEQLFFFGIGCTTTKKLRIAMIRSTGIVTVRDYEHK